MNEIDTLPQTTPRGGGAAFFEVLADNKGPLSVPQFLKVPELLDYQYDDKHETKAYMGSGKRAIGLVGGKEEITVALTMAASFGRLLNQICYGVEELPKQHIMANDTVGYVVPNSYFTDIKIRNCTAVHLGRWDSNTSVKINGAPATLVTGAPVAGQYVVNGGLYTFAKADLGKPFAITFVTKGVTVVQSGKVLAKLTHDVRLFATVPWKVKNDWAVLTQDPWNPKSDAPAVAHYQGSPNGVLILDDEANIAAGKFMVVTHYTDGQTCTSTISSGDLPAPAYQFFVDPPSAAAYVSDAGVVLLGNAGTAMTGITVGGDVAVATSTPTSGQYKTDGKGYYEFAAADVGDTVRLSYAVDYYSIVPVLRDPRGTTVAGATFYKSWGVRNALGKPLTRVAMTSPLSIAQNQYVLDDNTGAHYFDNTNSGDTFFIDCEFETDGGSRIEVMQAPVGPAPIVRIALNSNEPDQQVLLTFEQAMCEGMGVKTKSDDAGEGLKFTFKCAVDRISGKSHAINMSS